MNKIILYIATSLDGFIADINGGVDWLPHPKDDTELEAVGYKDLIERIDTILMGSRSYKQILSFGDWGWPDKQTYVHLLQVQSQIDIAQEKYASAYGYASKALEIAKNKSMTGDSARLESLIKDIIEKDPKVIFSTHIDPSQNSGTSLKFT